MSNPIKVCQENKGHLHDMDFSSSHSTHMMVWLYSFSIIIVVVI
jgi:hypothetical protein